jgi:hypothetical protein|tara:strand:- start:1084 stop:1287 length:204 start_codon:yes stop_codon:yes gene_type:complete
LPILLPLANSNMDDHTFENWIRVKDALEEAGKTDCLFYRRATTIVNGGKLTKDPFELPTLELPEEKE